MSGAGLPEGEPPAGRREIDHTADLGFEVWAGSVAELFRQATLAMCELCYERGGVRAGERRRLAVEGSGREEMLVRWLQDVYLVLEQEGWLTADVEIERCEEGRVTGTLIGEALDRERHTLHTEIKAITYHGLAVERDEHGSWRTQVIVDV